MILHTAKPMMKALLRVLSETSISDKVSFSSKRGNDLRY
jgi:hypothetical protein